MSRKPKPKTKRYRVSFFLDVEDHIDNPPNEEIVDEAVIGLIDEEISAHRANEATKCRLRFVDAGGMRVVEEAER